MKKRIAFTIIFFSVFFLSFEAPVFAQGSAFVGPPISEQCQCKFKCINPQSGGEGDGNVSFPISVGGCAAIRTNGTIPVEIGEDVAVAGSIASRIRQGCSARTPAVDLSTVSNTDVTRTYIMVSSCATQDENINVIRQINEQEAAERAKRDRAARSAQEPWSGLYDIPVLAEGEKNPQCKDMQKYNENPSLSTPKSEADARAICYGFCFDPKSPDYRANRPERCRFNNKVTCAEIVVSGESGGQDKRNLSPFELPNSDSLRKFSGTPQQWIGKIINQAMGVMGAIALAMYLYGGVIWMTAQGNSENVTRAKSLIVWTSMGVVVMLSSYVIVNFIFDELLF